MTARYIKADEHTLRVEEPKRVMVEVEHGTERATTDWDYAFLLRQRDVVIEQRNELIAQKEQELVKINQLIEEANKLGLKERVDDTDKYDPKTNGESQAVVR